MTAGTLYGIGVGPGNPQWITVQAAEVLGHCRCVYAPLGHRRGEPGLDAFRRVARPWGIGAAALAEDRGRLDRDPLRIARPDSNPVKRSRRHESIDLRMKRTRQSEAASAEASSAGVIGQSAGCPGRDFRKGSHRGSPPARRPRGRSIPVPGPAAENRQLVAAAKVANVGLRRMRVGAEDSAASLQSRPNRAKASCTELTPGMKRQLARPKRSATHRARLNKPGSPLTRTATRRPAAAIGFNRRQRRGNVPFDGRSLLARAVGKKVEQSPAADQRLGRGDRPRAASVRCSAAPGPQPTTKMGGGFIATARSLPRRPAAPGHVHQQHGDGKVAFPAAAANSPTDGLSNPRGQGVGQEKLLARRQGGEDAFDRRTLRGGAANDVSACSRASVSAAGRDRASACPIAPRRASPTCPDGRPARPPRRRRPRGDPGRSPRRCPPRCTARRGGGNVLPRPSRRCCRERYAGERTPQAAATSSAHCSESQIALPQYGRTIPVVPRIDRPPSIPSRGLNVFRAAAHPPGTETSTRTPAGTGPFFGEKGRSARAWGAQRGQSHFRGGITDIAGNVVRGKIGKAPGEAAANASCTAAAIICRGTGLIAGSTGGFAAPAS